MPKLQAASALGQGKLHRAWERAFTREGLLAAQVLLTGNDIADRAAYVNARHALQALFDAGAVPVVNENDATATDEITFGDNDALAAQVAILVRARLLVLLTEVDGVYTRSPGTPGAELVTDGDTAEPVAVRSVFALSVAEACRARCWPRAWPRPPVFPPSLPQEPAKPSSSRSSKASRGARDSKVPSGSCRRTSCWLRFGKPAKGRLLVDGGAKRAITVDGRSLLAVGVVACEGRFEPGDAVELVGPDGAVFAHGIAAATPADIASRARGLEAVHRDRLVVL